MSKRFSKSIISSVALSGLASIVLTEPAAARMTSCQIKHSYCTERCIMNYNGGSIGACIQRTCNHQHPGCGPESLGGRGGGKVGGRRTGLIAPGGFASGPQTPIGPVNPGPFPPGGMRQSGGFVPGGWMFRSAFGRH